MNKVIFLYQNSLYQQFNIDNPRRLNSRPIVAGKWPGSQIYTLQGGLLVCRGVQYTVRGLLDTLWGGSRARTTWIECLPILNPGMPRQFYLNKYHKTKYCDKYRWYHSTLW